MPDRRKVKCIIKFELDGRSSVGIIHAHCRQNAFFRVKVVNSKVFLKGKKCDSEELCTCALYVLVRIDSS